MVLDSLGADTETRSPELGLALSVDVVGLRLPYVYTDPSNFPITGRFRITQSLYRTRGQAQPPRIRDECRALAWSACRLGAGIRIQPPQKAGLHGLAR